MQTVIDDDGISLIEGEDSAVFLFEKPGVFSGHYFFSEARGRAAINLANRMLNEMFSKHGARLIAGLTPVENRAATWITRQLGFSSQGVVDQPDVGPATIFTLTREEFYERNTPWAD